MTQGETGGSLPLSGVRILDLSRMIAAPWCTQMLADLGAEVIKIERPGKGDDMRGYGPPYLKNRDGGNDDSPYYVSTNRNKKSVTVDLSTPEGADVIRQLAKVCDILVENYKVGDLKRYGLDYESMRKLNPRLIYCSVTGFGQTGPDAQRPGLDTLFQATSGLMSMTGEADGPPQKVGMPISDFIGGMYATVAVQAALRHREVNGGSGQHIDISLLECTMASFGSRAQTYLVSGQVPQRRGASTPANEPAGLYACADGDIVLSAGSDNQFVKFARALGRDDWVKDARYHTRSQRNIHRLELNAEIGPLLAKHDRAHWLEQFKDGGVMCAPINDVAEAFAEPQIRARGMVTHAEHPRAGRVPLIANPIRYSETPIPPPRISPDLGEHTDDVLSTLLGMSASDIAALRAKKAL
ncbi:CaiB/BaiF CoA transferase family protein [Ramlibacter sp.]|uniref:CaiB/BaiF CoA transferase family protein n=1 Tax=Ramlibacter sp. TaxID=1917967 RepID=UPI003D0CE22F